MIKIIGGECYFCGAFHAIKKRIINENNEFACIFCHRWTK